MNAHSNHFLGSLINHSLPENGIVKKLLFHCIYISRFVFHSRKQSYFVGETMEILHSYCDFCFLLALVPQTADGRKHGGVFYIL